MEEPRRQDDKGFTKALVLFGISAGIGLGLCGVGAAASAAHSASTAATAAILGAGLLVLSIAGLIITALVWALVTAVRATRR